MEEQPGKNAGGAGLALVVALLFMAVPFLYLISLGPAIWLDSHGFVNPPTHAALEWLYSPLAWVAENVPAIGPAIQAYAEWWD
jgi:hypothetical protein